MKAEQLKRKIVKFTENDSVGVVAISKKHNAIWWHVHDNEELPDPNEYDYAIMPFKQGDYEDNKRRSGNDENTDSADKDSD